MDAGEHVVRALRESEHQLRMAIDGLNQGLLITDAAGTIVYANSSVAVILAQPPEALVGSPAARWLLPPEPHTRRYELDLRTSDDRQLVVEVEVGPLRSIGGDEIGSIITMTDLTERRRLEEQLRHAQRLESLGRLAGGVAHDFNNLLTAITANAQLAASDLTADHPATGSVREVQRAAERAGKLTRQLLAFGRRQLLKPTPVDLNIVIDELGTMLVRLLGSEVRIVTDLTRPLSPIYADAGQVEQVIVNLAVNARDAMPDGGTMRIETTAIDLGPDDAPRHPGVVVAAGRYVRMTVSDTGVGFDAPTRQRLFEPFFTTKGLGRGTGLGLATVYGIVKQSGGYVWAYGEPGAGATFTIYWPAVDGAVPTARPPAATALAGPTAVPYTILVADDEPSVRSITVKILRRAGYRVLESASGAEALTQGQVEPGRIDLLVTDVLMPGVDGVSAAQGLSADRPAMRVLYMSGYTRGQLLDRGVLNAGTAFLEKPFSPSALLTAVRTMLA
jgi:two-component system, cell cycle sensor histidine kinase and response regulator CckA